MDVGAKGSPAVAIADGEGGLFLVAATAIDDNDDDLSSSPSVMGEKVRRRAHFSPIAF
jgi:hypothetical protein